MESDNSGDTTQGEETTAEVGTIGPFDIQDILGRLPHRYPMLLVDRVLEVEAGKRILAIKNVTINEPFFQGHFPAMAVMPGVLIIEALAQAAALLAFYSSTDDDEAEGEEKGSRPVLLMGVDKARFRQMVTPGDQLHLEVTLVQYRRRIFKFSCKAMVDGKRAASCDLMATAG